MSELNALLTKKEELLTQIRRIEENCEGIENEANARRISELNEQQMRFSAEKRDLQSRLSAIESQLTGIASKIQELSGTGIDKILEAIKNQRWFWFKDKPKVIFDRDTALLWADLNYFPWCATNDSAYSLSEIDRILNEINVCGIHDYTMWRVPTPFELWYLVEDKTFPYVHGDYWRIQGHCYWCVEYNNNVLGKDLDDVGPTSDISTYSVYLLPCCSSLVPTDYENNISKSNNFYSEKEKLQFTLNVFVTNGLVPLFNDESITHLYRQIYVEKPALIQQLSNLQSEINALQEVVLLSSTFDYYALLTGYDIPAINSSVIKYHEAVTSLATTFLDKVREYEGEKKATIREFDAAGLKLGIPYHNHPQLAEAENEALEEGRSFLARHLSLNMEGVRQQIQSVKAQGEALGRRIAAANSGKDSLSALAQIAHEERPDFAFVAENLAHLVRSALQKIEFFEAHHDFALRLMELWAAWEQDAVDFRTRQREEFLALCEEHHLSADWGEGRYAEWAAKRLAVLQAFLPLAEFVLQGNLLQSQDEEPTPAEKAFLFLQAYREDMDSFYREGLWKLNMDFGSAEDYGRKEKLETEMAFYWRTAHWMKGEWREWLFSLPSAEDRTFLARWIEPMKALPAEALLDYTRVHEELPTPSSLISGFLWIREPAGRSALESAEAYENEWNQRGDDFRAVIEHAGELWKDAPAPGTETPDGVLGSLGSEETVTIRKTDE